MADSNRIEVDLKLLQDQNFEALKDFGDVFAKSVTSLESALANYTGQLQAAADRLAGGGKRGGSPYASRAEPPVPESSKDRLDVMRGQRTKRFPTPPAPPGGGDGGSGSGSVAPVPKFDLSKHAFSGPNINDYERGKLHLANLNGMDAPQFLRYLSNQVGTAGWSKTQTGVDDNGNAIYRYDERDGAFGRNARRVSGGLGLGATGVTNAQSALAALGRGAGAVRMGSSSADFYAGLGYDRTGPGSIPGFSKANQQAWKDRFKAMSDSWLGFNPNLSFKEAREINKAVGEAGWTGDTADRYKKALQNIRANTGMTDFPKLMEMMDKSTRFGAESVSQFEQSMKDVSAAAAAAHIHVSQLAASLDSASNEVASATGIPYPDATRQLTAFTAGTGLDPSRAVQMLTDPKLGLITDMLNPGARSTFDVRGGAHRQGNINATARKFAGDWVGIPVEQWKSYSQNPRTSADFWERIKNVNRMLAFNPGMKELLGGMSLMEMYNQSVGGAAGKLRLSENNIKESKASAAFEDGANPWGFQVHLKDELAHTGLKNSQKEEIYKHIRGNKFWDGDNAKYWKGLDPLKKADRITAFERQFHETPAQAVARGFSGKLGHKERDYLKRQKDVFTSRVDEYLAKHGGLSHTQRQQVEITLNQNARQILEFVKAHPGYSNSKGSFSAPALHPGSGAKGTYKVIH